MVRTHYPRDISLKSSPLGEAWLEVRWQLSPSDFPGQAADPEFPYALGAFYGAIKDMYPVKKDLDSSRAPLDLLPHVVRHQFWRAPSQWPVLQIGPGVATLNFTRPYTWGSFREQALFLREKLMLAYEARPPVCTLVVLRYLNAEPFEFRANDVLAFLSSKLNTRLQMPPHVPGEFSAKPFPTGFTVQSSYDLREPKGQATVLISTGARSAEGQAAGGAVDAVMWRTEVLSEGSDAPDISQERAYAEWLDSAHAAAHEWFLALTEGGLLRKYQEGAR